MAKKAYVGVNNVARKIKRGYVGVRTAVPIYETQTTTEKVTINSDALLSKYFKVTHGDDYGFAWSSSDSQFRNDNSGIGDSEAKTTLTALQDCTLTYTCNYDTEESYDEFTLTVKGSTIYDALSGSGTAKTRTDTLTKGQTIVFLYTKDGSVDGGDDYVAFYNMSAAVTTTKEVQVGTDYRNVARKIKKAYIGIGGVARPCWSGGELAYFGTITELSVGRQDLAATSVGNFALFGGGCQYIDVTYNTVDAYDQSLTRTTPTALSQARYRLAATSVGDYALFGGGGYGYYGSVQTIVDAYDKSLTRTTPTALHAGGFSLAATTVGDYALFGGGQASYYMSTVDAYDKSLTKSNPTVLSQARCNLAAATVGDYALFGGGYGSSYLATVDAYDKSLTRTTPTALSQARRYLAATSVGDYALFGGGCQSTSTVYNIVDAYDKSLTRSNPTVLNGSCYNLAATSVGDYALFGGGQAVSVYAGITAYDETLTRTQPTALSQARRYLAATSVGDYALFGGGYSGTGGVYYFTTVDAYIVA